MNPESEQQHFLPLGPVLVNRSIHYSVLPISRYNTTSSFHLLPRCLPHCDSYPGSVSRNKLSSVLWLALV